MIAADVFRQRFEAAHATIADWIVANGDVAAIEEERTATFWRLAVAPRADQTCPFELIVHTTNQILALDVGPESFEGQPLPSCEDLPRIVAAIAAGEVVIRAHIRAGTGIATRTETIIGGSTVIWRGERVAELGTSQSHDAPTQARDHRFVRYRL